MDDAAAMPPAALLTVTLEFAPAMIDTDIGETVIGVTVTGTEMLVVPSPTLIEVVPAARVRTVTTLPATDAVAKAGLPDDTVSAAAALVAVSVEVWPGSMFSEVGVTVIGTGLVTVTANTTVWRLRSRRVIFVDPTALPVTVSVALPLLTGPSDALATAALLTLTRIEPDAPLI